MISKHCTGFVFMFSSFFTFTELVSPDFPFIYGQTDTFIHAQSFVCIVHLSFNDPALSMRSYFFQKVGCLVRVASMLQSILFTHSAHISIRCLGPNP